MTHALTGIGLAFFLSLSSLTVVLLRVSPLVSPEFALPLFFLSLFIVVSSSMTMLLVLVKRAVPWMTSAKASHEVLRSRKFFSSSLRQGIFVASATCFVLLLHLLHILNWWIGILIYAVFLLIEMAMGR